MRLRQNFRSHVGREEDDREDDDEDDEVDCYNDFCFALDSFWEPTIEDFEASREIKSDVDPRYVKQSHPPRSLIIPAGGICFS